MGIYDHGNTESRSDADRSPKVLAFLKALDDLQERFDLSLSHQDGHGAFEITHGYGDSWVDNANEIIEK